jgi:hypothetical protein
VCHDNLLSLDYGGAGVGFRQATAADEHYRWVRLFAMHLDD